MLEHELLAHEQTLLDPKACVAPEVIARLLADEVVSVDAQGRIWDKDQLIGGLASANREACAIADFRAVRIAPRAALASFRYSRLTAGGETLHSSLRSSIWMYSEEGWRLLYHQDTLIQARQ